MSSEHDERPGGTPPDAGRDVTMRGVAPSAAEAQARLAAIVTGSEDAIVAKTLQGIVTAWNPAAERLFGYTPDEMVGRSILTIVPPELHGEEAHILASIARGERIAHHETERVRKDGSRFPVALTISPVRDGDGRITGASKILRDISERKALEAERARYLEQLEQQAVELETANEQLHAQAIELELQNQELTSTAEALEEAANAAEELRAEAERANDAKSRFLATMSHELRTPINAIVGYAQLLELGVPDPVTPTQQQQLARIGTSAQHLLDLVNDVLDGAKLDFGEMHVAREAATMNGAITAALMLVSPQANQHRVRLIDGRDTDGDVPYVGDDARVRQILVNLLSNAVKFTPAGGTITVTSGTAADPAPGARVDGAGPWAYVQVTDTGVGIAPEQQTAVFEPFVQVGHSHGPYTRSTGGTGLGLTISRRLARLMGGDLTLESTVGVGSTFTLWLPVDLADPCVDGDAALEIRGDGERSAVGAATRSGLQALLPSGAWHVHELAEVGHALREECGAVLRSFSASLRTDPQTPRAHSMAQPQLEDHAVTLLADLSQSLVILAGAGEAAAALMRDSTAILRTIAESHGARRFAQGWSEVALRREHQLLRDAIDRGVRTRLGTRANDLSDSLSVLMRITERTQMLGLAAYRYAAAHAGSAGAAGEQQRDTESVN
jgi:PAS domain S-box-containing protein